MEAEIADLLNLLELETAEVNLFRGEAAMSAVRRFLASGGLGQALTAAPPPWRAGWCILCTPISCARYFNAPMCTGGSQSGRHSFAIGGWWPSARASRFSTCRFLQVVDEGLDHQIGHAAGPAS